MIEKQSLYKFHWSYGRAGDLEGIFVATQSEVDATIGKYLHFGEILGKHSDVRGTLYKEEVVKLTDDTEFIKRATEYGLVPFGYNPLDYLPLQD